MGTSIDQSEMTLFEIQQKNPKISKDTIYSNFCVFFVYNTMHNVSNMNHSL